MSRLKKHHKKLIPIRNHASLAWIKQNRAGSTQYSLHCENNILKKCVFCQNLDGLIGANGLPGVPVLPWQDVVMDENTD